MTSPVNTRGDTRTTTMTSSPAAQVSVAELVAAVIALPVSDAARAAARARLADTAFATLVGSETAQGRASVNLAAELYGRSSLAAQAFRLSAACRLTEIDDVDLLSCITPGSIVVPTVLAVLSATSWRWRSARRCRGPAGSGTGSGPAWPSAGSPPPP
jgi:2-methylcitrate dehydratase PrpD